MKNNIMFGHGNTAFVLTLGSLDVEYLSSKEANQIINSFTIKGYKSVEKENNLWKDAIFNGITKAISAGIIVFLIALFKKKKSKTNNQIEKNNDNDTNEKDMNQIINNYKKVKCKVCEKEILEKDSVNGICQECHQEILKRLDEKNKNKE